MAANQTECSRLEQSFVTKFFTAEKCKQCWIYKRMSDMYEKNTNGLNIGFLQMIWVTDTPVKKKFRVQWSIKKMIAITIDLLEIGATVSSVSYCQQLWQNSPYLLNGHRILPSFFPNQKKHWVLDRDCKMYRLHLWRGVRPLPTSVLDFTLNNLLVSLL